MARVAILGLLLLCTLAFGMVVTGASITASLVAGFLITVCLLCVTQLVSCRVAVAFTLVGCLCALCMPACAVFLPVFGADAASRLARASSHMEKGTVLLPTVGSLWCSTMGMYAGNMAVVVCIIMGTVAATCIGGMMAMAHAEARHYRTLADAQRGRLRRVHARISDLEAARSIDVQRARLRERTRIAREIHDNVGHMLTGTIMLTHAHQVVAQTSGDELHAAQFHEVGERLDEAMTMIRRSVHDLKDQGTDFQAILDDAIAVAAHADVDVRVVNHMRSAPSVVAHCFAAVVREGLANAMRHGAARHVTVTVNDLPGLWQCIIQDDGHRYDRYVAPYSSTVSPGIGISDIEERARALDGTAVCGWHGNGWRVFVSIPKSKERR